MQVLIPVWLWPMLAPPFVGSFLGVLISRLPMAAPVVINRSACAHCGTRLGVGDLVPIASFLALRGCCRHCGQRIGWVLSVSGTGCPGSRRLGLLGRAGSGYGSGSPADWLDLAGAGLDRLDQFPAAGR